MSEQRDLIIATLAGAILQTRGSATVDDIKTAWEDAKWTLYPAKTMGQYKDWQTRNGMTPTTSEEDRHASEQRSANMQRVAARMAR